MKMIDFVNNVLKTDVQLKMTLKQLVYANAIITGILGGLVALVIFGYRFLMIQWLWLLIGCSTWFICTGGLIYIRMESPLNYLSHFDEALNKTVVDSYIHRELRQQYAYEGYIFQALVILIGLNYALILNVPKILKNTVLQRIAMYLLLATLLFLQKFAYDYAKLKMTWWDP
mmetsp:Transcript_4192/g.7111  ORF Transcript_4192/g.7111 Transcript_4192/m.7111 type:complete len:172 (+) Transcript_4192:602-1117(+)